MCCSPALPPPTSPSPSVPPLRDPLLSPTPPVPEPGPIGAEPLYSTSEIWLLGPLAPACPTAPSLLPRTLADRCVVVFACAPVCAPVLAQSAQVRELLVLVVKCANALAIRFLASDDHASTSTLLRRAMAWVDSEVGAAAVSMRVLTLNTVACFHRRCVPRPPRVFV